MKTIISLIMTAALILSALTGCAAGGRAGRVDEASVTPDGRISATSTPWPTSTPMNGARTANNGGMLGEAAEDVGDAVGDVARGVGGAVDEAMTGAGNAVDRAMTGAGNAVSGDNGTTSANGSVRNSTPRP